MKSEICHKIKYNKSGNDCIETPENLAKFCISLVPIQKSDTILDAFAGNKIWHNNYPVDLSNRWYCEIKEGIDFFDVDPQLSFDWIITNPPYSILDKVFEYSCRICLKGFGYLIGINNLTPKRIELCNKKGFGLTKIHICKIFKYFGMSVFVLFEKGKDNIISYDRIVWKK